MIMSNGSEYTYNRAFRKIQVNPPPKWPDQTPILMEIPSVGQLLQILHKMKDAMIPFWDSIYPDFAEIVKSQRA